MKRMRILFMFVLFLMFSFSGRAEDGYELWMRYELVSNAQQLDAYKKAVKGWLIEGKSPTLGVAHNELKLALKGLLGVNIDAVTAMNDGTLLLGTPSNSPLIAKLNLTERLKRINEEGYLLFNTTVNGKKAIVITGNTDVGVLYGMYHFLRLIQSQQDISKLSIESSPKLKLRILNHWDNLDRTVERGYAGFSLWDWHKLPEYIDQRYHDYARANASIGINGTVLTNVNANSLILRPDYLQKVKALADVFRPYGIRVYLTARFSSPIELGGMKTADPLDPQVQQWWKTKTDEIYKLIPDFGGYLVKANSEGQPGPQNYGRNHADGANMLADAVQPYNGVVMWRAFVYDNEVPVDRAKQANMEFEPLDGKFRSNVMVQVKNGPIDFQPREPFHPLFGRMPKTPLMMEFQITQEYLGQATNLVYLAPMYKECLASDTYARGAGSTVAKVIDGSIDNHSLTGMAGVSNIGNDRNWTGHVFGQSNWYCYGRLAWDHQLTSEQIAEEWIRMTFSNNAGVVNNIKSMMMASHEAVVNYMTPLGLHHIMGWSHHYGPAPWIKDKQRADWTSVYYHQADSAGIGFNRTASGSNAVSQYHAPVARMFSSTETCPEKFLLWFHHLPWDYKTKSGNKLWDAIAYKYQEGVDTVRSMKNTWKGLSQKIDEGRFQHVRMLLDIQEKEAIWWKDACLLYFQTFSKMALPKGIEKPKHDLEYYQKLTFPYAPGIRPHW